jgi:hypothetical protein
VKVVRELSLHHGVNVGPARPASPWAQPEVAATAPPLPLTDSLRVAIMKLFEDKKSAQSAVKLLKSFLR